MRIKLITGVNPLFHLIPSSKYFEIDEFGNPMHNSLIAKKVEEFKAEGEVEIYTQSEAVLNGFRIRRVNKTIKDLIIIQYYNGEIHSVQCNERGEINNWSEGLFDQTEKDISTIWKLNNERK